MEVFQEAYKSPASIIILDDIERAMEFVTVGGQVRFSNVVLQTLLVLVKDLPPPGRKLLVIGTTTERASLDEMGLSTTFNLALEVPVLVIQDHYAQVLAAAVPALPRSAVDDVARRLAGIPIGIKKLLNIIDMAKHNSDGGAEALTAQGILDCAAEWGVV